MVGYPLVTSVVGYFALFNSVFSKYRRHAEPPCMGSSIVPVVKEKDPSHPLNGASKQDTTSGYTR